MKREIKFRAWDTEQEVFIDLNTHKIGAMLYDNTIVMSTGWDGEDNPTWDWSRVSLERYEWLQFTGLLDKNGKEIYEGDIVSLDSWEPSDYEVQFIDGAFCLWNPKCNYANDIHYTHHAERNQSTIIGNIYQNPELLNS